GEKSIANVPQRAKVRTRGFRVVDGGRQEHQADEPGAAETLARVEYRSELRFARAVLRRLAGEIDLDEQIDSSSRRRFFNPRYQLRGVDRVDQIEARAGFFCFVRLEMADQMPAERKIRGLVHLGQRFLDAVLAEIDLPGRRCFAYG